MNLERIFEKKEKKVRERKKAEKKKRRRERRERGESEKSNILFLICFFFSQRETCFFLSI